MKRKQTTFPSIPVKSLRLSGSSYRYYAEGSEKLHSQNMALGSIMIAAQSGQLDIVRYHVENAYKSYKDQCFGPFRRNLLHLAAISGSKELIEYILNEKLAGLWQKDGNEDLPFNLADKECKVVIAKNMNWEQRKGLIYWFEYSQKNQIPLGVFRRLCQKFLYNVEL